MAKSGNTRHSERVKYTVAFTHEEAPQVETILGGANFNRWVRAKIAEEAAKQGKPFNDDLPQAGGNRRKQES